MDAGFDGVEVHGANGYLIDQFLRDSINDRTDAYGGSIANRARLLLEVMQAVVGEIGGGRTGLRLSPVTPSNDAGQDSDPQALFEHAVAQLAPLRLAFIEVVEGQTAGARDFAPFDYAALRRRFDGAWMVNNGYQRQMALDAVASGAADLVSFGRPFIGNPDLVRRLREDAPLNALDAQHVLRRRRQGLHRLPDPRPARDGLSRAGRARPARGTVPPRSAAPPKRLSTCRAACRCSSTARSAASPGGAGSGASRGRSRASPGRRVPGRSSAPTPGARA